MAAGDSGFTRCYGKKGMSADIILSSDKTESQMTRSRGGGGEAALHSKDKSEAFFKPVPARDQTLRLPFFTQRWSLSQFSELGCFSLANWREDSLADGGDS